METYFIVNIDVASNSFSIIPISKEEYEEKITKPAKTSSNMEETIQKNEYNNVSQKYYEEEDIVDLYFQDYLKTALDNINEAYDLLDETFKQKKFGNIENYKQYVNKNKVKYEAMCKMKRKKYEDFDTYQEYEEYYREISKNSLSKYDILKENDATKYICIDSTGTYYIFYVTDIMQYTAILDTYTVDLPEFTEKYNNAEDKEKVLLNIQKVFLALNDGDFNYVYNKLDSTFRQNNFPTESDFENYVKQNFYEKNSISYSNYRTSGDLHIYGISVKNRDNEENPAITKNFIMQLKEGTDFVMSFTV